MRAPRNFRPRISPERLLLLVALTLFVAGALWIAHRPTCETASISRSWLGALPSLGLPLVHALLHR
ncbi:MAG TPA: hypothetical protein VK178_13775 [Opitutaceae bacterium]|nr:hypothetical protein [Opitutaceae bacterium]